jgi:hypothetical protein
MLSFEMVFGLGSFAGGSHGRERQRQGHGRKSSDQIDREVGAHTSLASGGVAGFFKHGLYFGA